MLRDRSLLALTTAELVSTLGSQFSALALPWFVLATTHSSTRMARSRVSSYDALGPFVLIPLGTTVVGPLAAHFGVRRTLLVAGIVV